jgi:starch-binding outer membrane protein, SusD/RagB family
MKKIIYVFLALILTSTISCKKFLTEQPYDFIAEANFYKTEGDANAALNGAFNIMQLQQLYGRTIWILTELTGELMKLGGVVTGRPELYNQTFTSTNGEIGNWWNNIYVMINRANDVIKNVEGISMDQTKKANIIGNARFLRALGYFDLVRSFGPVPLLTTPTTATSDLKPTRAPIAAVYTQIIEDLKYAQANCYSEDKIPASEKGRASSGAATALLAKVYLTRASSTAAEPTDYQNALAECNKIIALSPAIYTLIPFADIFDPEKENTNKEVIFAVQFDLPPSTGNITPRMHLPKAVNSEGNESFYAENSFATSYAPTDNRRNATVLPIANSPNYWFSKFQDPKRSGNNARNNQILLRYADVLLMQSEALNQINSADPNKFNGINQVRARAGLTPLTFVTTVTKDDFINALVQERAWEFAAEGLRRFDLLRLNRLKQVQKTVHNITLEDKYLLFPIPESELALNPNLTQNPGYK